MYYFLYKTTNLINNKIYIGKHVSSSINDDYLGFGVQLKRAIKKYGKENFTREILEFFDSENELLLAEAKLVNTEFIQREDTYNIALGGKGSFFHVNSSMSNTQRQTICKKGGEGFKQKLKTDPILRESHRQRSIKTATILKEKSASLDHKWVTNTKTHEQCYIKIGQIDLYLNNGWVRGRKGGWGKHKKPT